MSIISGLYIRKTVFVGLSNALRSAAADMIRPSFNRDFLTGARSDRMMHSGSSESLQIQSFQSAIEPKGLGQITSPGKSTLDQSETNKLLNYLLVHFD